MRQLRVSKMSSRFRGRRRLVDGRRHKKNPPSTVQLPILPSCADDFAAPHLSSLATSPVIPEPGLAVHSILLADYRLIPARNSALPTAGEANPTSPAVRPRYLQQAVRSRFSSDNFQTHVIGQSKKLVSCKCCISRGSILHLRRYNLSILRTPPARPGESGSWTTLLDVIYICEIGWRVFEPDGPRLVLIQVFAGNVVLWHLVRANSLLIGGVSSFHARHYVGLERVSFLDQFVDALRVRALDVR